MKDTVKKIKYQGMAIKVRVVGRSEIITNRMLASTQCDLRHEDVLDFYENNLDRLRFMPTECVGDKVSDHPRVYVEVLSKFYNPVE